MISIHPAGKAVRSALPTSQCWLPLQVHVDTHSNCKQRRPTPFRCGRGRSPLLCFWPSAARRTESTHAAMSHAPMPTVLLSRNEVHATGGISEVLYLSTSAASDAHSCSMCCDNRVCKLSASESDGVLITHSFTLLVTAASMVAFAHFLLR